MNSTGASRRRKLCFIDLFCGCGGFSLGLHRAGFRCLAALDSDPAAIETFRKNLPDVPHILEKDLTKYPASELARLLGDARPDLIAGRSSMPGLFDCAATRRRESRDEAIDRR